MALIVITSAKGSPGASTTALAIAGMWPREALLAEVDPLGSDLVYRQVHGEGGAELDPSRGMVSLALDPQARRGLSPELVRAHSQRLPGGQDVLLGLTSPEQAIGWKDRWSELGRTLAAPGPGDVIADIGRVHPGSPAAGLLSHASLVLLVSRTTPEDLAHMRARAAALHSLLSPPGRRGAPVGVLLIAPLRGQAKAAEDANKVLGAAKVEAQVAGVVAFDPKAAEQLAGRRGGKPHKTQLVSSVRHVVVNLGGRFGLGQAPQPPAVPSPAASTEGVRR